MENPQDLIQDAKDKLPDITPTPPSLQAQSSANDLKARLEWGEPGLTIVDIRDHEAFNQARILGAVSIPMEQLVERAKASLELNRDIYIYGETDQETAQAASQLREAGFKQVAELRGGLAAWKEIAGPTEGSSEAQNPPPDSAYNVASQVAHHQETQSKNT
jgi:rhodanese-related sulfurtransferase